MGGEYKCLDRFIQCYFLWWNIVSALSGPKEVLVLYYYLFIYLFTFADSPPPFL